jgi:hypothetical protein
MTTKGASLATVRKGPFQAQEQAAAGNGINKTKTKNRSGATIKFFFGASISFQTIIPLHLEITRITGNQEVVR